MRQSLFICLVAALILSGYLLACPQSQRPTNASIGASLADIGAIFNRH